MEWDIDANLLAHRPLIDLVAKRYVCRCGDWNCASLDVIPQEDKIRLRDGGLFVEHNEQFFPVTARTN